MAWWYQVRPPLWGTKGQRWRQVQAPRFSNPSHVGCSKRHGLAPIDFRPTPGYTGRNGVMYVGLDVPSQPTVALRIKRAVDIAAALPLLVLASPFILALAIMIRISSPGPALFRARRVGRAGREFTMYKFRSMERDAALRLEELAGLNQSDGMVKIPGDPRVTRTGEVLRRFSLDEIPQLWNVLKGDMSLVGPRPHDCTEVFDQLLAGDAVLYERLSMRPGLTGMWQVTARGDPSLAVRVRCDLAYVRSWSLWLDARLLAATIPALARGRGGQVNVTDPSRPDVVDGDGPFRSRAPLGKRPQPRRDVGIVHSSDAGASLRHEIRSTGGHPSSGQARLR